MPNRPQDGPTLIDILDDVLGMLAGGVAALMPFLVLSVPVLVLVLVPLAAAGLVVAVAGAVVAAVAAPPFLLARTLWRRRR